MNELIEIIRNLNEVITEMAYQAHNADLSDAEKLQKIRDAWMKLDVVKISELLPEVEL